MFYLRWRIKLPWGKVKEMAITLGFDVYGTLINTHGVLNKLQTFVGNKAQDFSNVWREKQLEYSFRRGLMQNYETFAVCTRQSLDYTNVYFKTQLTDNQKQELFNLYRALPAFDDVHEGLKKFQANDFRLFAFSNGATKDLEILLTEAGLRSFFLGIVSVDEVKSFKPNPGVYCHFLRKTKASNDQAWLISSNPFDVIGAISAGMKSAWIRRKEEAIFDPWGIEPTMTSSNLIELSEQLIALSHTC